MIWILIPCFQGARRVGDVVRGARATGHPVLVVDDGLTDGSAEVAEAAGATRVLRHPANHGKGAALATGFAFLRGHEAEAVVTMDADGQHDPVEVPRLVAAYRKTPGGLVVGVRSFQPEDMPRRSRIGNRISTWWISKFAGVRYQDTQSGYRVYPRALFAAVELVSQRFDTETELLLRAARMGVPLSEVPIQTIYQADRVTHFHGFRDTLRVIRLVLSSPFWAVALLLCFAGACGPRAARLSAHPVAEPEWRTLRAEHLVEIDVTLEGGRHEHRRLRGVIAVERPDRFRLRALGPAGITLFDLVSVQGRVRVREAIRDPNRSALGGVIESMAGDLQAAFQLTPIPSDRAVRSGADQVTIAETPRTVRLSRFRKVAGRSVPTRIDVENRERHYSVQVTASAVELDQTIDPQMFAE